MKISEEKGAAQRVLLLVLLLVVVLFGYLYFFTGIIKPREEETRPPAPPAPMTKKPIPPRPGTEEVGKGTAAVPAKTPSPSAPAVPETGKKSAVEQPKPATQVKPEVSKAQVAPQAKPDAVKTAPVHATANKVPPAASAAVKEKQASKPQKKAASTAVAQGKMSSVRKKQNGRYILVGEYIVEADLKKAERQLKKAGNTFAVTTVKKAEPMHRLHVADFAKRAEADVELKKVQKLSGSAFVLPAKDKYSLYAGSYFREQQAAKEKERLGGKGVTVTLEKTEVAVPVKRLSTGAFCTKEQAETEAARLRKAGIKVSVVPVGK